MDPKLSPGLCIATKCSIVDPTGSTILHECQFFDAHALFQQSFAKETKKNCQITTIYRISSWVMQKSDFHMTKKNCQITTIYRISSWVMQKSDFHMAHVEIGFLVISAIDDFTNFFQRYRNLSMASLLVTHTGISIFSLNNVIIRLIKIMNRADKNWAHF